MYKWAPSVSGFKAFAVALEYRYVEQHGAEDERGILSGKSTRHDLNAEPWHVREPRVHKL